MAEQEKKITIISKYEIDESDLILKEDDNQIIGYHLKKTILEKIKKDIEKQNCSNIRIVIFPSTKAKPENKNKDDIDTQDCPNTLIFNSNFTEEKPETKKKDDNGIQICPNTLIYYSPVREVKLEKIKKDDIKIYSNALIYYFNMPEIKFEKIKKVDVGTQVCSNTLIFNSNLTEAKIKKRKNNDTQNFLNTNRYCKKQKVSIDILGKDCLVKIFSYLPLGQRLCMDNVCTKWREANNIWHNVKEIDYDAKIKIIVNKNKTYEHHVNIEKIIKRCKGSLTKVHLREFFNLRCLSVLCNYCVNIEKLYITIEMNDSISYKNFLNVFNTLKHLKYITINLMWDNKSEIDNCGPRILDSVSENVESISLQLFKNSSLDLCHVPYVSKTLDRFKNLHQLILTNFIFDNNAVETITKMKKLELLHLHKCTLPENQALLFNLSNLKSSIIEKVADLKTFVKLEIAPYCLLKKIT